MSPSNSLVLMLLVQCAAAQRLPTLPDAPSSQVVLSLDAEAVSPSFVARGTTDLITVSFYPKSWPQNSSQTPASSDQGIANPAPQVELDANGNPIPLERRQPKRILGIMPNYRTVSAGAAVHPPGWKYNFSVARRQAFDYSSFFFLGLTSLTAEGLDSHASLGKGVGGFYAYTWRGFLDKSDNTFLSAWLLASALHEDTRYYPLGSGHTIPVRALYVISRQAVARTYGGKQTPNIAGLGGKVITQLVSRTYYPASASDFSALATKFAYSAMRDIAFSAIREFYPDISAHYIRKHRQKLAMQVTP